MIPAFNEEAELPGLIASLCQFMESKCWSFKIIVVDDGSTDRTKEILTERLSSHPLELVVHPKNLGLGAAMNSGLKKAVLNGAPGDIIVTMDADNTHQPSYVENLKALIEKGVDVAIASRYRRGSAQIGVSRIRVLGSIGINGLYKAFFPIRGVRDYTTGFRAYRGEILTRAFNVFGDRLIEERGFTCMPEILLKLRSLNIRVQEIPYVLRYDLKRGTSKMRLARTATRTLWLIVKLSYRRIKRAQGR